MPLFVSLVAFAGAATFGILANWNRLYDTAKPSTLDKMCNERWKDDEVDARYFVAMIQIWTIGTLRRSNNQKARMVTVGLAAQVVAVVALSFVVYRILLES
jgi:hypothetical protein